MPRKGYKRASGRSVGMPEVMAAQNFNRRISAEEALILATAGGGSNTEGFRNLLELYQELLVLTLYSSTAGMFKLPIASP